MVVYISLNIIIVLLGIFWGVNNSTIVNTQIRNKKKRTDFLVIIPSFIMFFIVSAFRGDFTSDYKNYVDIFKYINTFNFFDLFNNGLTQEKGYIFLSRFIGVFTDNTVYLFVITTLIILVCFYFEVIKSSAYLWLSFLMFATIGAYYNSFNIMRQIMAVSIVFAGSKYLYNRNLFKYIMTVLLAALFHKTALIMIAFYFILGYRFNLKKFILVIASSIAAILYLGSFIDIIQKYFYAEYTIQSYGMTGLRITNAIMPLVILVFTLLHYKKLNMKDNKTNIWTNAVVFFALFTVLGLKVQMVQRMAEFLAPYALLLIPSIISKIKSKELRTLYIFAAVVILISYNFVVLKGTGYDPYYFIWNSQ